VATGDWAPYSNAVGSGQYIQPADDGVWDALNPRWTLSRCVQRPASPARRRHRLVVAYASLSHVGALGHARGGQRSRSVRRPLAASADARARRRRDDLRRRLDVQSRGRMGHLRRRTAGDHKVVRQQARGGLACVSERPKTLPVRLENNSRTDAPKHHGEPASTTHQKAGPAIRKGNLAKSAKPPSPVQIRAAPPFFLGNSRVWAFACVRGQFDIAPKGLDSAPRSEDRPL
jgi:hypothetical protein